MNTYHQPFLPYLRIIVIVIITLLFFSYSCKKSGEKAALVPEISTQDIRTGEPVIEESSAGDSDTDSTSINSLPDDIVNAVNSASDFSEKLKIMEDDYKAHREKELIEKIDAGSKTLNGQGYNAYQKKNYESALELFLKAIEADNGNCFAHFNAACTIALLLSQGANLAEPYDAIYSHLDAAVRIDPHFAKGILDDTDLDPVRDLAFEYSQWKPCPGDCCPDRTSKFQPDGTYWYQEKMTDLVGGPVGDESGEVYDPPDEPEGIYGKYSVVAGHVFVYVPGLSSYGIPYPYYEEPEPGESDNETLPVEYFWLVPDYDQGDIVGIKDFF